MSSKKAILFLSFAVVTLTAACTSDPSPQAPIIGAWEFVPAGSSEQRGLLIFTKNHYSMMFSRGKEARQTYPQDRWMTDAETVAAYNSITANSGTYSIDGDQVTISAFVANDPNYMTAWPNNSGSITLRIEGDQLMWIDPNYIGLEETMLLRRVE